MVNEDGSVTLSREEFDRLMSRASEADAADYCLTMAYVIIFEADKHSEEFVQDTKDSLGHYISPLAEKLRQLQHAHIVSSPLYQEMLNEHGMV
jgi:hypothetical protein